MNIEKYKEELISRGFLQAKNKPNHFYKELMPYTAMGINLEEIDNGICVVYGCGSTAFTKFPRCEDRLIENGFWDNCDMNIRHQLTISDLDSELFAAKEIGDLYAEFYNVEKDTLLKIAKERKKTFINIISQKLKPLGFKKKGNFWIYAFQNDITLSFHLYSRFSDEYRCELHISKKNVDPQCWQEYIPWSENKLFFDWQLIDEKSINDFIENRVIKRINEIISIGTEKLGDDPNVQKTRICTHNQCDNCWIGTKR